MKVADKQKVLIQFLVGKNRRLSLPCLTFVTPKSISKGLMGVREMSRSVGAFFVFEKSGYHKFWMKNTGLKLDICFFNEEGIFVERAIGEPYSETLVGGNISSKYAIEVINGFIEKNEINLGTRIRVKSLETSL